MTDQDTRVTVFVYGSLKQNSALHSSWMRSATLVGQDTLAGFTLLGLGAFPAMLKVDTERPQDYNVAGEIYLMDADRFKSLATMEENAGYSTIDVTTEAGRVCKAFMLGTIETGTANWVDRAERLSNNRLRVEGTVQYSTVN